VTFSGMPRVSKTRWFPERAMVSADEVVASARSMACHSGGILHRPTLLPRLFSVGIMVFGF